MIVSPQPFPVQPAAKKQSPSLQSALPSAIFVGETIRHTAEMPLTRKASLFDENSRFKSQENLGENHQALPADPQFSHLLSRSLSINLAGMALAGVDSGALKGELDRSFSNPSTGQNGAHNKLDVTGEGSSLDLTAAAARASALSLVQTTTARGAGDKLRGRASCGGGGGSGGGGDEKRNGRANSVESHAAAVPEGYRSASNSHGAPPRGRNQNNGRPPDTPRKSLVNRQAESLGWANKPAGDTAAAAAAVVVRPRYILPLRNGTSGRRRASSPTAAHSSLPDVLMPSSTSGTFFGSFDDSRYWDYAFRFTLKGDMGHHCRECKRPFSVLNEAIAVRRSGDFTF